MTAEIERTLPPDGNIEDLVWAMLDEQISDDDIHRLEDLLGSDEDARQIYLQCVQLHVDLMYRFNPDYNPARDPQADRAGTVPAPPVGLPVDLPMPSADASMSDPAV
jgi:hypothetical protein